MSNYHRLFVKGGTYFFTVVTYKRQPILCEEHALNRLKAAFRYVMKTHPYRMDGLVVLPDHRNSRHGGRSRSSHHRVARGNHLVGAGHAVARHDPSWCGSVLRCGETPAHS